MPPCIMQFVQSCANLQFLLQRNEAGSSAGMELLSFQKAMEYLSRSGLKISTFISDRHGSIAKSMRDEYKEIKHYFDLWHLKKSKLHFVYPLQS